MPSPPAPPSPSRLQKMKDFWKKNSAELSFLFFLTGLSALSLGFFLLATPVGFPLIASGVGIISMLIMKSVLHESLKNFACIFSSPFKAFSKASPKAQLTHTQGTTPSMPHTPSKTATGGQKQPHAKSRRTVRIITPTDAKEIPRPTSPIPERKSSIFDRKIDDSKDFNTLVREAKAQKRELEKQQRGKFYCLSSLCFFRTREKNPVQTQQAQAKTFPG